MAGCSVEITLLVICMCLACVFETDCYENYRRRNLQRNPYKRPQNLVPTHKEEVLVYSKEGNWKPMTVQYTSTQNLLKHKQRPQQQNNIRLENLELTTIVSVIKNKHSNLSTAKPNATSQSVEQRISNSKPKRPQEIGQESKRLKQYEVHEDVDDFPQVPKYNTRDNRYKPQDYLWKNVKTPVVYRKPTLFPRYHVSKDAFIYHRYRKPELHHNILRPIQRII